MGDFSNPDHLSLAAGSLKRSQSQGNPTENANILVHRESCRVSDSYPNRGGPCGWVGLGGASSLEDPEEKGNMRKPREKV